MSVAQQQQVTLEEILRMEFIELPRFKNEDSLIKLGYKLSEKIMESTEFYLDNDVAKIYQKAVTYPGFDNLCRRKQVGIVVNLFKQAEHAGIKSPSYRKLGKVLGIPFQSIQIDYGNFIIDTEDKTNPIGKPPLLTYEQEQTILKEVIDRFEKKILCTTSMLVEFCHENFKVYVDNKCINRLLKRNGFLKTCVVPDENGRVNKDLDKIKKFYDDIEADINGTPTPFVFNLDEIGFNPWADRKNTMTIVPRGREIPLGQRSFSVPRSFPHTSFMACVCMDGQTVPGLMICPCKTLSSSILQSGLLNNCCFVHRSSGYIDLGHFLYWLKFVFVPFVRNKKLEKHYDGESFLIMDGCSAHCSPLIKKILEVENIKLKYLVPHCSHIMQPLDLGVFAVAKNKMRKLVGQMVKLSNFNDNNEVIVDDESNPEVIEQIPNEVNVTNYADVGDIYDDDTILEEDNVEEQQQEPMALDYFQIDEDDGDEVNNIPVAQTQTTTSTPQKSKESKVSILVVNILKCYREATFELNVISAFKQCGFHSLIRKDDNTTIFQVQTKYARMLKDVPYFQTRPIQQIPERKQKTIKINDLGQYFTKGGIRLPPIEENVEDLILQDRQLKRMARSQNQNEPRILRSNRRGDAQQVNIVNNQDLPQSIIESIQSLFNLTQTNPQQTGNGTQPNL